METFAGLRRFVDHPEYAKNRSDALASLRSLIVHGEIDPPLVELVELFSRGPPLLHGPELLRAFCSQGGT